jgi:7-cyano-7-deazaguanine synthase in queuosine biosynthesis
MTRSATPNGGELNKIMVVCNIREIELNKTCNYIHLISGGLDSAYSLLKTAKKNSKKEPTAAIHPIFFDYGHFAAETEWACIAKIIDYVRNLVGSQSIIDVPLRISLKSELFQWSESDAFRGIEGKREPEIENRNLVLFSVLASYLMACAKHQNVPDAKFHVTSGFKDTEMKDSSDKFFKKFAKLLFMYQPEMKFRFPVLKNWSRLRILEETKKLLDPNERLARDKLMKFQKLTTSCYSPANEGEPCGRCSKCKFLETKK